MQAILMNFGDAPRVIHDANMKPVILNVGTVEECELDPKTIKLLRDAMQNDSLMLVPADYQLPSDLATVVELLKVVNDEDYHVVLSRATAVLGADPHNLRPTREQLRVKLRDFAIEYAQTTLAGKSPRVAIKEEGDDETRQQLEDIPMLKHPLATRLAEASNDALLAAIGEKPIKDLSPPGDRRAPGDLPSPPIERKSLTRERPHKGVAKTTKGRKRERL